jgi:hypothetical protein
VTDNVAARDVHERLACITSGTSLGTLEQRELVRAVTNDSGAYSVGSAHGREQFEHSQEVAGGFVDFLLGRGARHPR